MNGKMNEATMQDHMQRHFDLENQMHDLKSELKTNEYELKRGLAENGMYELLTINFRRLRQEFAARKRSR